MDHAFSSVVKWVFWGGLVCLGGAVASLAVMRGGRGNPERPKWPERFLKCAATASGLLMLDYSLIVVYAWRNPSYWLGGVVSAGAIVGIIPALGSGFRPGEYGGSRLPSWWVPLMGTLFYGSLIGGIVHNARHHLF